MRVIDETEDDIRKLIEGDFGKLLGNDLRDDFDTWLHFKARHIPPRPRQVTTSPEVANLVGKYPAIALIRNELRVGIDISPWMSDSVRVRKTDRKADPLFNAWQITHLHLGIFFTKPDTIKRTGPLLFCHVTGTEATLLNVQSHGSWTDKTLLEIMLRTNPAVMAKYEIRGVTPQKLTEQEHAALRRKGVNVTVEVGGRAFNPGWGLVTSGHAIRFLTYGDHLFRNIRALVADFEADKVATEYKTAIYARIGVPVRLGVTYDRGAFSIIDKNRPPLQLYSMVPIE